MSSFRQGERNWAILSQICLRVLGKEIGHKYLFLKLDAEIEHNGLN